MIQLDSAPADSSIHLDNGFIYTSNREIYWGKNEYRFDPPSGIFVDCDDKIYIADTFNQRIVRMDNLKGKNWSTLSLSRSEERSVWPVDLVLDSRGRLYILDGGRSRIVRVNDLTGKGWMEFGSEGFGNRQFYHPSAITVDSSNRIYIADTGNRRVVRIDDLSGKGWITSGEVPVHEIRFLSMNE